jgi:hypothetical protein
MPSSNAETPITMKATELAPERTARVQLNSSSRGVKNTPKLLKAPCMTTIIRKQAATTT